MPSIENILQAARKIWKTIDPATPTPAAWDEQDRGAAETDEGKAARFAHRVVHDLLTLQGKALEGLVETGKGIRGLHDAATKMASEADTASAPPSEGTESGLVEVPPEKDAGESAPTEDPGPDALEPSPEDPPSLAALRPMEALIPMVKDLPVDPGDLDFIDQSLEMLGKTDPGDVKMEAKILYSSLWRLQALQERYGGRKGLGALSGAFPRLQSAIEDLGGAIDSRLGEMGFMLFPDEVSGSWADLASSLGKEAVAPVPLASHAEKGAVLGLARSGVKSGSDVLEQAHVLVSAGPSESASILEKAALSLVAVKPADSRDQKSLGKGIKEIRKFLSKLHTQPDGYTFVRFTVNILHDNNRGYRLKPPLLDTVGFLEKGGYQEILVPLGDAFDDSFSPNKYERKRVPSDRPPNTILKVARRGFLDPNGTPIQKAMVEVSAG